jgi:hypothetical protein
MNKHDDETLPRPLSNPESQLQEKECGSRQKSLGQGLARQRMWGMFVPVWDAGAPWHQDTSSDGSSWDPPSALSGHSWQLLFMCLPG